MADNTHTLGWIGAGRMGYPMAERLAKSGFDIRVWNRTRAKAEPLSESGAGIVDAPGDVDEESLRAHLREQLVRYKVPRSFEWVDHPLRDYAGKVRRSALRDERVAEKDGQ